MIDRRCSFFYKFRALLSEAALNGPVFDLGTSGRFSKEVGLVRELFDGVQYFAGGFQPKSAPSADECDFACDLMDLKGIPDGQAGSLICLSVLEHVEDPFTAVKEMHRILRPTGLAIISTPFFVGFHGKSKRFKNPLVSPDSSVQIDSSHENYSDFWRFTHEGLALMFSKAGFSRVDVWPVDGPIICLLKIFGVYYLLNKLPLFSKIIALIDRPRLGGATTMHFVRAQK
jgi:SAM-dependent methyltransferase